MQIEHKKKHSSCTLDEFSLPVWTYYGWLFAVDHGYCPLFAILSNVVIHCPVVTNAQSSLRSALIYQLVSQRFTYEWMEQTSQNVCIAALWKPATWFPWFPLRLLWLFRYRRTQNAVLSGGALVGWHWEHLSLKGKRMGGGQRTLAGGAQTLHCASPRQMGKAKYAACFLVNQSMKLNVAARSTERPTGCLCHCSICGPPVTWFKCSTLLSIIHFDFSLIEEPLMMKCRIIYPSFIYYNFVLV